jgi:hypothetical protein
MITLQQASERNLPTSVRLELFCRVLEAVDGRLQRRGRLPRLDPRVLRVVGSAVDFDGDADADAAVAGDELHVELLRVAEALFALRPGRLVTETAAGAPWVLEHAIAQLRARREVAPKVLLRAFAPFRSNELPATDDDAATARRKDAGAALARASTLATGVGPGEAVLWALDEACRIDPDFGDPRDRRRRVAEAAGLDAEQLRAARLVDMSAVLQSRDLDAATRVAATLFGPGADAQRVLDPFNVVAVVVPAAEQRGLPKAALVGAVVVVAFGAFLFFGESAPAPVDAVPVPVVAVAPVPVEPVPVPPVEPIAPVVVEPVIQPMPAPSTPPRPTLQGPAIVNVWLEGCSDCIPTFNAWLKLKNQGGVPADAKIINIAYGSERETTRAFAARYHVDDNLGFDVDGSLIVQPTGIGTFTTFVIDNHGAITWRGRAVDDKFQESLASAWLRLSGHDQGQK